MDYSTLTDEELAIEKEAIDLEVEARRARALIPQQMDELSKRLLVAKGTELNDPWVQPVGGHDTYPQGWTVTHADVLWESLMGGNVWEPGVSGWRKVPLADMTAEWIRPTGTHDAYKIGDKVLFEEMVYKSLIDANAWSPMDFPQGWELLPSEPPAEVPVEGEPVEGEPVEGEPETSPSVPAWVKPAGGHDAYNTGDRVLFEGSVYESLSDGNTWSPTEHAQAWTLVADAV